MRNRFEVRALTCALLLLLCACTGGAMLAGSKVEGIYEDAQGYASIEFMPAGKAHFSLHGVGGACTYKIQGTRLTVVLEGETFVFTINNDDSLTGPSGTYLSRLKKKK
jgi:hypothetical protein